MTLSCIVLCDYRALLQFIVLNPDEIAGNSILSMVRQNQGTLGPYNMHATAILNGYLAQKKTSIRKLYGTDTLWE